MLDHLLLPIQRQLSEVEAILLSQYQSAVPLISSAAHYVTQNGGKRIRPSIFILTARLAGQTDEKITNLAGAIELLHTASLLHDDVIDDAHLRRGQASAKVKWGNQVSVLLGDFLWSKASELFIKNGNEKLWQEVTKTITAITEGQILEITRLNDITIDEEGYQKIIDGKTASLFGICGQGAAIMQNLPDRFEWALKEYGFNLGIAFQLTDDVLDYTSQESILGKNAGADLREGKLTLPMIIALKHCNANERKLIQECLISDKISPGQFNEIVDIIRRHGGLSFTSQKARDFAKRAQEHLAVFKPSIERDALWGLADYAVERQD